jgi:hypothetical protein
MLPPSPPSPLDSAELSGDEAAEVAAVRDLCLDVLRGVPPEHFGVAVAWLADDWRRTQPVESNPISRLQKMLGAFNRADNRRAGSVDPTSQWFTYKSYADWLDAHADHVVARSLHDEIVWTIEVMETVNPSAAARLKKLTRDLSIFLTCIRAATHH